MTMLWRRTAGAFKDRNSIWLASMARRTSYRHPELEAAIIKATNHDEERVDYRNAQRVFQWLRTSPAYLRPLIWSLSRRMRRTSSWVVALKGLILMHGVFCCDNPNVRRIGRLPFDLSNFHDAHSDHPYAAFVRLYFAFLDQRAVYLCSQEAAASQSFHLLRHNNTLHHHHNHNRSKDDQEEGGGGGGGEREGAAACSLGQELVRVQKWQALLDLLLQIKPLRGMQGDLVLEAMDCVVIEIFDIYSSICNGIARVLTRIYAARSFEATIALGVLKKATAQIDRLTHYFQFCSEIGVLTSSQLPKVDQIPEEDILQLERIIAQVSNNSSSNSNNKGAIVVKAAPRSISIDGAKAQLLNMDGNNNDLKTVITDKWEVFDDDQHHHQQQLLKQRRMVGEVGNSTVAIQGRRGGGGSVLPLALPAAPWDSPPLIYMDDTPDLISLQ